MAKQIIEFEPLVDVKWPLLGISRRLGFQSSPPSTCPDALNVRNDDVFERRLRGGSRPGLVQVLPPKAAVTPLTTTATLEFWPTKDTYLYLVSPDTPQDGGNMAAGYRMNTESARAILHFDLNIIPGSSTVIAASLTIYQTSHVGNDVLFAMKARRILTADVGWVEAQATWNNRATATAWSVTNARSPQTGPYSTSDPLEVDWTLPYVPNQAFTISGLAGMVQDALTSRSEQLHLMLMATTETGSGEFGFFRTRTAALTEQRPKLVVTYEAPV
jgi:hypothetical protein